VELQGWRSQILDRRLLHNRCPDSNSPAWRLLGSAPATRRYKVRPYAVNTHGVTGWRSQRLDGRLLHNRSTDSDSVSWRLLGWMLATRQYKVPLYRTKTHEVAVLCRGGQSSPGGILLDGCFLHNHWAYSNPVLWRLLGLIPATPRYNVCLYVVKTDGVIGLAIFRTRWQITPQPRAGFQFCFLEVVGLDSSYTPV